jgi:hypothetical protein
MVWFPRKTFILVTLVAVAFLPAACSGGGSGQSTSSRAAEIAACPLLSPADIQKVVGAAMADGKERESAGGGENEGRMTGCVWDATSDQPGSAIVTLLVWSWPSGSGGGSNYLESFRQAAKEYKDLQTPEPVDLGEEALWDGMSVHVRSGDVSFSISVSEKGLDPAKSKEDSQALAEIVLGKLTSS